MLTLALLALSAPQVTGPACAESLADQSGGPCIEVSSTPVLGSLYPLSSDFFIDPSGNVGIGTTNPVARLEVAGNILANGDVIATNIAAPLGQVRAGYGSSTNPTYRFGPGTEVTGLSSPAPNTISFVTNGSERMQIDADGHIGAGVAPLAGRGLYVWYSEPAGVGVYGQSTGASGIGVVGSTASPTGFGVFALGALGATGTKSFVQPHPEDSTKEIRFICLEGNESGTYCRGASRLEDGRAIIEMPEEFRLVSEAEELAVQLTPVGERADLWVESQDLERIIVRGDRDVEFHYFVNGIRRGFADVELVRENKSFVPTELDVPFGTQYPTALRRVLVENGTLNADFTPNETTALRNGWKLRFPDEKHAEQRAVRRSAKR